MRIIHTPLTAIGHGCDGFDGYTHIKSDDGTALKDVADLQERMDAAFLYDSSGPGQLFCNRATILLNPLRDDEAVIVTTHQYDN